MSWWRPDPRPRRLDRLLRPVVDDLIRFALRLTRDEATADDLLQASVERAMDKLDQLRDDGAFRAWMTRIVYRTWLNWKRPRPEVWVLEWVAVDREQRDAREPGPHRKLEARRLGRAIEDALDRLPDPQREAVLLVDVQGFGFREAAGILELPIGTVASRVARARSTLRRDLAEVAREQGVIA